MIGPCQILGIVTNTGIIITYNNYGCHRCIRPSRVCVKVWLARLGDEANTKFVPKVCPCDNHTLDKNVYALSFSTNKEVSTEVFINVICIP